MRHRPRWVARCSVHVPLSKPPQPTPHATGAGVPERKIGFEALEASAKLRKSNIDCLSGASFDAARSEQLRLPAEGPLKRRDGSSCRSTLDPLPGLEFSTHTFRKRAQHKLTEFLCALCVSAVIHSSSAIICVNLRLIIRFYLHLSAVNSS